MASSLRIAVFGQAPFGRDVTVRLAEAGHEVVAVYAPPEGGRPDPLAAEAEERGWPLFRYKRFRKRGEAIPEIVEEYLALAADLNVLPFTTVILPPEIVDAPRLASLCFHPSKLPAYRGGSAIPWQIILGADETAATVFRPDEGVDTGPIVVQKAGIPIASTDTAASLYFDRLYPAGVEAMVEAVAAVANGTAVFRAQSEEGASHQPLLGDEHARIDWSRPAAEIHQLVRGCDPNPGAIAECDAGPLRLFGSELVERGGADARGAVMGYDEDGRVVVAVDGGALRFKKLRFGETAKGTAIDVGRDVGLARGDRLR
jgi:methionyl-tRNA formyltransferase